MKKKTKKNSYIVLECANCRFNLDNLANVFQYTTTKNKQTLLEKLNLKKYCKFCQMHQIFIEIK